MKSIKPLGHKSYGSIPHLSKSRKGSGDHNCSEGHERIVLKKVRDNKDLIIVQEKLDGSNCSVAKVNGEILALGRAGYLAKTSQYKQHKMFHEWVIRNYSRFDDMLKDGERVVGEWLVQAHGTIYDLPHEPFVIFDLMKGHDRLTYHNLLLRVLPFGFTVPKLIHIGQSISLKRVINNLEPSGHGALDNVEGAVFRCERDNKVDFLVKYVRHDKIDGKYFPEDNNGKIIWNKLFGVEKK